VSYGTIRRAFELAGVEFIDENGGGPGVRLRKRHQKKGYQKKGYQKKGYQKKGYQKKGYQKKG